MKAAFNPDPAHTAKSVSHALNPVILEYSPEICTSLSIVPK